MPFHPYPFLMLLHLMPPPFQQVAVSSSSAMMGMVRPVTGADIGIRRAEIRPGLREIILCKDQDRKVGLRLRAIDNVSHNYNYLLSLEEYYKQLQRNLKAVHDFMVLAAESEQGTKPPNALIGLWRSWRLPECSWDILPVTLKEIKWARKRNFD